MPLILLLILVLMVQGCTPATPSNVEQLQRIAGQYVDQRRPGAPKMDRTDYSAGGFEQEIQDQRLTLEQLLAIDPEGLSLEQDIDRRLLIGIVRSDINTALAQRLWENDAALYIPGSRLGQLFEPEYAGTEEQHVDDRAVEQRVLSVRGDREERPQ